MELKQDNPANSKFLFDNVDGLLVGAEQVSLCSAQEFRHSVFLYFIARHMVAIHETLNGKLPFQVWNEYRNAIDHFMRYITDPENSRSQLDKMEGHLQRAVLDCCKLFCHRSAEWTENKIEQEGTDILRFVDNGDFFLQIAQLRETAAHEFVTAKTSDGDLGKHKDRDRAVLRAYLTPCFTYLRIRALFIDKRDAIEKAAQHILAIRETTSNEVRKQEASKLHLKSHLVGHAVWASIAAILTLLAAKYWPELSAHFSSH